MWGRLPRQRHLVSLVSGLFLAVLRARGANLTQALRAERERAAKTWYHGRGLLWLQHFRRAGGTSLCHLLRAAVPGARFLTTRGEACQPQGWVLHDAAAVCDHNLTLLARELRVQGGNAFAQEYGTLPGRELLGHRARRHGLRDWLFVTSMRDPWARFWSQLRYEMATCLVNAKALALCIGGNFELLGNWWSPTAHRDSVMGVPGAAIGPSPALYADNYYMRVILNRTDVEGPPLTEQDLRDAMALLNERVSVVVIVEDFARSALQLACALGLDLGRAQPLLRTRVRPYESHEALLDVPDDDAHLGEANSRALRARFRQKNKFDYALYAHARDLAKRRLKACGRSDPAVEALRLSPAADVLEEEADNPAPPEPVDVTVDDLFGCSGGSLEVDDNGSFVLKCPRNVLQHAASWWASESSESEPRRKLGEPVVGAECWRSGFSWAACCAPSFGPLGNADCWDTEFTHDRCCAGH